MPLTAGGRHAHLTRKQPTKAYLAHCQFGSAHLQWSPHHGAGSQDLVGCNRGSGTSEQCAWFLGVSGGEILDSSPVFLVTLFVLSLLFAT